jgi:hypothetical protein
MRGLLLERANDSGITGIGKQTERMPQPEGGLQRAGAGVELSRPGIRLPSTRPQRAEVTASPRPGDPLAKIEIPERVVDSGRLPVGDAGQLAALGQQLVFVKVTVNQDWPQRDGAAQLLHQGFGVGRPLTAQPADGRERKRVQHQPAGSAPVTDTNRSACGGASTALITRPTMSPTIPKVWEQAALTHSCRRLPSGM